MSEAQVSEAQVSEAQPDDAWLVEESGPGFDRARANYHETLFTVGNGRLGTRGSLEEGHRGQLSGTFLNGVYDGHDVPVIDLVNAPDWLDTAVHVDGGRLDADTCTVVEHRRVLDLRDGVLTRSTVFADAAGRRTRLDTVRCVSMADRRICALRFEVTPENHDAEIVVETGIDGDRRNLERLPLYPAGTVFPPETRWEKWARARHLRETARSAGEDGPYLEMRTLGTGIDLGYLSATTVEPAPAAREVRQRSERITEVFRAEPGRPLRIDKLVAICTSRDPGATGAVRDRCRAALAEHRPGGPGGGGFDGVLAASRAVWEDLWEDCDCEVVGDVRYTRALRFAIYHLLIAANPDDPTVNIGAKSLSGEGYRGHVFWDTEIFMLPFFILTRPDTAKALLRYRHHTLDGARANSREYGTAGARYAWESADTGREECPQFTPDGANRFWTREEEIHVSADVAYGMHRYVEATGDTAFRREFGAEVLFETSRFWVDRVTRTESGYALEQVMGPDEFHSHIDNNTFTNRLAQWHLNDAVALYDELRSEQPGLLSALSSAIGLSSGERDRWQEVADGLVGPHVDDDGVIEQFTGYFDRDDVPITEWDENDMPRYPKGYHHFNCETTQLLKQPDVVMLMYLLPDEFSREVKRANFDYYEARTLHKSSLSPSIHAIIGMEVGDTTRAVQYFERSAFVDLADNQGNTGDGMHIASAGGTWQVLVNGFGGLRVLGGRVTFTPWLPPEWEGIRFRVRWRGRPIRVTVDRGHVELLLGGPEGGTEEVVVDGRPVGLTSGSPVRVARNGGGSR